MNLETLQNRHGQRLDATFHPAPNTGQLAVIGHGVTANKDRPLIEGLAKQLAARGLPTLRFSFAGNGKSDGNFEDCTLSSEVTDLRDVLDHVYQDGTTLTYIGHSMGAAVGALVAAQNTKRIHNLVSLAGMVHVAAFFDREFGGVTPDEGFMWDEPQCPLSQACWDDAHAIGSTLQAVARITQPWLFIHGTDDDVVPIEDSRDAYEQARNALRKRLLERPGESHMFTESAHEPIASAIIDWIQNRS